jgi:hypothetical protein
MKGAERRSGFWFNDETPPLSLKTFRNKRRDHREREEKMVDFSPVEGVRQSCRTPCWLLSTEINVGQSGQSRAP